MAASPRLSLLDASQDLASALAESYPPLQRYCPHLTKISVPQAVFLLDEGRESVYGGAAGGGKSDALLMAALQYVDQPGYAALILRRTFPELRGAEGLLNRGLSWLKRTDAHGTEDGKLWTFPSGATLRFGHVETEADRFNYDGQAYQFVGFDELTSFTELQYDHIGFSRARRTADVHVPIRTRGSCTPIGVGVGWVKKRFITDRADDVVFVPAFAGDNPGFVPGEYEESLSRLPEHLRRALLEGDWSVFEGAAFHVGDDHLIDTFPMVDAHDRFEACDYGLNGAPWALVAVDYEGNLIFDDMLYERELLPSQLAPLVTMKRKLGWGFGHPCYADPSIWHRTGTVNKWGQPAVLADEFTEAGVPVSRANNDPRAGLIRLRELLRTDTPHPFPTWHPRAGEPGGPRVFFHRSRCAALVEELQSAPLQASDKRDGGEIVDPEWESRHGHAVAMCRYAVMTRPMSSVEPPQYDEIVDPDAERRAAIVKHYERREKEQRRSRKSRYENV